MRDFCGQGFGVAACPSPFAPHPDFERIIADDRGLFGATLGADHEPVVNPANVFPSSTVTSAARLDQFYHDTPNVNEKTTIPLVLTETSPGSGVFQFSSDSFFPIDGQLLGNEGQPRNFSFTLELHTNFTYKAGQTFPLPVTTTSGCTSTTSWRSTSAGSMDRKARPSTSTRLS